MNPLLANKPGNPLLGPGGPKGSKPDLSTLSAEEKKLFEKYGKLPKKTPFQNMQKERKYFDSGDYMMNKAGVTCPGNEGGVGTAIPTPEFVQHASPPSLSSSPTNSFSGLSAGSPPHSSFNIAGAPHPGSLPIGGGGGGSPFHSALSPHATSPTSERGPGGTSSSVFATSPTGPNLSGSPHGISTSPRASFSGTGGIEGGSLTARRASTLAGGLGSTGAGVGIGGGIAIPGSSGSFSTHGIGKDAHGGPRMSPPISFSPLSSGVQPSSFPIQSSQHHPHLNAHHASERANSGVGHGSSPVKPSGLAMGSSGFGTDGIDEIAVEDEDR